MITFREPMPNDEHDFLDAMQKSVALHHPWTNAPQTAEEFKAFVDRSKKENHKYFLVIKDTKIAGVFNISEIVRGCFQNAYLGFYAVSGFEGQGIMSAGLKLILKHFFEDMKMHRFEANIQPENNKSIRLVKNNGFQYEGQSPYYLKINDVWCTHEHWVMIYETYIQNLQEPVKKDRIDIISYNSKVKTVLEELKKREPIFHHPEFGTTRADFEKMTVDDYWEIGASGKRYDREECIQTMVARYQDPNYIKNDIWETQDFECRPLSDDTYLLTYTLIQGKERRITKRSTIWKNNYGQWMILYHQGTLVSEK